MTRPNARIGHQLLRLRPGALGGGDVARAVLRLPGEALAHRVPRHLIAELRQRVALADLPRALDELHDADALAAPEHAQREAEGGRRLALAGAGVDDQQALLDASCPPPRRPARPCAWPSWRDDARPRRRRRSCSWSCSAFHEQRQSGDHEDDAIRAARRAAGSAGLAGRGSAAPARCPARCPSRPRWRPARSAPRRFASAAFEAVRSRPRCRASASIRLVSHSVRQSTRTGSPACSASLPRGRAALRRSSRPRRAAPCGRRSRRHLLVARLRSRDVDPRRGMAGDEAFGKAALARTGAAEDERQIARLHCNHAGSAQPIGARSAPEAEWSRPRTAAAITSERAGKFAAVRAASRDQRGWGGD